MLTSLAVIFDFIKIGFEFRTFYLKIIKNLLDIFSLAFILKQRCDLLWHKSAVCQVLEEMVEGLMKKKETDEVAAMKLHYFSSYLQQAFTHMLLKEKSNDQKLKVEGGDLACEKSFDIILDTAFSSENLYLYCIVITFMLILNSSVASKKNYYEKMNT